RCRRLKLEASEEALELLAARTEGNLLAAHQELTQLALLAPDGRVTPDTVLAGVADSARFDVFGLGEAVLKGEAARALRVLAGLRAEGTEPTLVLWALSRALRDVWSARGGDRPPASQQRHRAALEQALRRAEVRFLPTGSPPHRAQLYASPERRLQMVRAAVADQPSFVVDDREVRRSGVSYSVDTLTELRREYPERSLCLLLGMDAF